MALPRPVLPASNAGAQRLQEALERPRTELLAADQCAHASKHGEKCHSQNAAIPNFYSRMAGVGFSVSRRELLQMFMGLARVQTTHKQRAASCSRIVSWGGMAIPDSAA